MPSTRRMPALALAALLALGLAGCASAPAPSSAPPSASPSRTPLFASDEQALEAATAAYAAYLKMSDTISHDGGKDPERIKPYVTKHGFAKISSTFDTLRDRQWRTTGDSSFRNMQIEKYGTASLSVYLCSDVSKVRVLNAAGQDVTPERDDVLSLRVTFVSKDKSLRVDGSDLWPDKEFC